MVTKPVEPQQQLKVNWPLVVVVETIGILMIVLAFCLEHWFRWVGVTESVLVNVGSTVLLVGILYFVQRRFLKRVTEAVQQATIAGVRAETRDIRVRLDELDDRMDAAMQRRNEHHEETVEAIVTPTYGNLARAIADANALGAVLQGSIGVQGSAYPGELGLTFSWGFSQPNGRFNDEGGKELAIVVNTLRPQPDIVARLTTISVKWNPGESFEDVGVRLVEALQRNGIWRGEETLIWPQAIRNLRTALDWASRSRRHTGDPDQLSGQLIEMVANGWAITTAGVECPSLGILIPANQFPEPPHWRFKKQEEDVPWIPPAKPEGTDEVLWNFVVQRARSIFPIQTGPFKTFPDWYPLSTGPDDD
jgi:hypothetical protein